MIKFFKLSISFIFIMVCLGSYAQNNQDDVIYISEISENVITPVRIALDVNDNFYITDNNLKSIIKYDASGNYSETLELDFIPISIAIDKEDNLFIGDKITGKVYKLKTDGTISEFYTGCLFPADMEYGIDDLLYIVDSERKHIVVLDLSGNVVRTIGEGLLVYPSSIAFDKKNQRILIGEHGAYGGGFNPVCKVWIFDLPGNYIDDFGSHGGADGEFYRIQGLTIGKCGNIYVSESFQGNVSVFDETGAFITKFGQYGNQTGDLNVPLDIVFDSQARILIGSYNKGTIDVFNVPDTLPTSNIINSDAVICTGETTDIQIELTGTAPWSFSYTVDGINPTVINTSNINYTLTVSDPGIYEIVQLNDANFSGTCFTGSAVIEVTDLSPTSSISDMTYEICEGETTDIQVDLTGSSPWSFTYTVNDLDPTNIKTTNNPFFISATKEGIYEIISIEGNGCTGTNMTGNTEIIVHPLPSSNFTVGNDNVDICDGSSAELDLVLTGTAPWNLKYIIDGENETTIDNINNTTFTLVSPIQGTYEVSEISDANCTNYLMPSYPEVIIHPKNIAAFSYEINGFDVSFTNMSQNAESFYWDFGDGSTSTETNPVHTYAENINCQISLTAYNSYCSEHISIQEIEISSSIVEEFSENQSFKIYPNPASEYITLEISNLKGRKSFLNIYTISGEKIFSQNFTSDDIKKDIDLQNFTQGLYLIMLQSEGSVEYLKLIISK